ncbi:major royal jelly [Alternaria alternata]|nr:major royal jelly [Alternaria alternata]
MQGPTASDKPQQRNFNPAIPPCLPRRNRHGLTQQRGPAPMASPKEGGADAGRFAVQDRAASQ